MPNGSFIRLENAPQQTAEHSPFARNAPGKAFSRPLVWDGRVYESAFGVSSEFIAEFIAAPGKKGLPAGRETLFHVAFS